MSKLQLYGRARSCSLLRALVFLVDLRDISEMSEAADAGPDLFSRGRMGKIIAPLVIGVVIYAAMLAYTGDTATAVRSLGDIPLGALVLATVLSVASFWVRWLRWHFYLSLTQIRVPIVDSILVFFSGFVMSVTPGKMGEVLKSLLLKEAYEVPVAKSAPIVVAERMSDLVGMLCVGAIGATALPQKWVPFVVLLPALGIFLSFAFPGWGIWAIDRLCRLSKKIARFESKLLSAWRALTTVSSFRPFVVSSLISFVAWGTQSFCVLAIANAFPDVTVSSSCALLAYSAPLVLGTISMIPGGLGATEASMTAVLESLGGAGMSTDVAVLTTILVRVVTFWLAIALGLVAMLLWKLRHNSTET